MRKDGIAKAAARDQRFTALVSLALAAGMEAGNAMRPAAMKLRGSDGRVHSEPEGMCGFAWVNIPGTSSLAKWIKANAESMSFGVHNGYPRGLDLWCRDFNQSWERKKAWASAVAGVLNDNGQSARPGDRLD